MRTLLLAGFVFFLVASLSRAGEPSPEMIRATDRFVVALGTADFDKLKPLYHDQVVVHAGSELLKPEWEMGFEAAGTETRPDRSKDRKVSREDLLAGYRKLIAKVGKEEWKKAYEAIPRERIVRIVAEEDKKPFSTVKKGDVLLIVYVSPEDQDNPLVWVFRAIEGKWKMVAERTDY